MEQVEARHLSYATNPVLSNFIAKLNFFIQFDISVPNYSGGDNCFAQGSICHVNRHRNTHRRVKNRCYKWRQSLQSVFGVTRKLGNQTVPDETI